MRPKLAGFVVVVQTLFVLGHGVFWLTWLHFWRPGAAAGRALGVAVGVLALSFLTASLIAQRHAGLWARSFYTAAAAWLGMATYFFLASCACWAVWAAAWLAGIALPGRALAGGLYGLALLVAIFGMVNATRTRVRRVRVALRGLPPGWQGARVALVSDLHLGHVRRIGFARRVVALINGLDPRVVLIAGDLFDGTPGDLDGLVQPWSRLLAPGGAYYVSGNHESFVRRDPFLAAAARGGLRVLDNQLERLDGLQLLGIHYTEAADAAKLAAVLRRSGLDPTVASIVLTHAPDHLAIVEAAGVALLVAGHTHAGQFFPVTHIVQRIYGRFTRGLQRLGGLQVFTSCGAGTWGPPLRVGTRPEVVLMELVAAGPGGR